MFGSRKRGATAFRAQGGPWGGGSSGFSRVAEASGVSVRGLGWVMDSRSRPSQQPDDCWFLPRWPPSRVEAESLLTTLHRNVSFLERQLKATCRYAAKARRQANPCLLFKDLKAEGPAQVETRVEGPEAVVQDVDVDVGSATLVSEVQWLPQFRFCMVMTRSKSIMLSLIVCMVMSKPWPRVVCCNSVATLAPCLLSSKLLLRNGVPGGSSLIIWSQAGGMPSLPISRPGTTAQPASRQLLSTCGGQLFGLSRSRLKGRMGWIDKIFCRSRMPSWSASWACTPMRNGQVFGLGRPLSVSSLHSQKPWTQRRFTSTARSLCFPSVIVSGVPSGPGSP